MRALVVFQLCGVKILVSNNEIVSIVITLLSSILFMVSLQLMKIGKKVLGKTLFAALMKPTFYGQFVAGEVSHSTVYSLRVTGIRTAERPHHRPRH